MDYRRPLKLLFMDMLRYQSKHVVKCYSNAHDTLLFRDTINEIYTTSVDYRNLSEILAILNIEHRQIPKWKWWWIRDYNRTKRDAYFLAIDIIKSIKKRFPNEKE